MSPIRIDTSRFPLVVVTFLGPATDEEFRVYLDELTTTRARGRSAWVFDATSAGRTPANQRRMQAEWLSDNEALLRETSLGSAFVIDSPIVRGVLTAILWMSPIVGGHAVFAHYGEAEQWAIDRLREAGLEPGADSSRAS